ncbi:hypothetical protein B0H11DRAFT_1332696 [Mycena galericulata]|nr:hypothetical protein B0H11DRAFT_1332696 [Mycena galericulata]
MASTSDDFYRTPGGEDPILSDTQRLINVMKTCFLDLATSNEQKFERLSRAVEALHPKASTTDKKNIFWNAYKGVSEEYDKEFQEKYSTDLETSLIFAGLFSAVSSAFIIQIQPSLQQDPNAMNQALLRLLIHNTNSSVFTESEVLIPEWNGPPSIIVAVQILLYISLFSTLLAAFLAVLGKQWLMYYGAARDRGNMEQRCLERQRKVDGLRKWGFDLVMQISPMLQQLALLLFGVALSIYLGTIQNSIAIIVFSLTCLGIVLYSFFGISAIFYPDSPFQTPLADYLIKLIPEAKRKSFLTTSTEIRKNILQLCGQAWKLATTLGKAFLPHYMGASGFHNTARKATAHAQFDGQSSVLSGTAPEEPSSVASAILWVLETSTDAELITAVAGIAADPDLCWPFGLNLEAPLTRLSETFIACFNLRPGRNLMEIRPGFVQRAIYCGQAYGVLKINSRYRTDYFGS